MVVDKVLFGAEEESLEGMADEKEDVLELSDTEEDMNYHDVTTNTFFVPSSPFSLQI